MERQSPIETISRFHNPRPQAIDSFAPLLNFKRHESAIICGNGPSLIKFFDHTKTAGHSDLIGTSALAAFATEPTFIFHEPLLTYTELDANIGAIHISLCEYAMQSHLTQLLNLRRGIAVIENPIMPPGIDRLGDLHPYFNPLLGCDNSFFVPSYVINETSDSSITKSLGSFAKVRSQLLLYFRCSIVKAISLSYILGYQEIHLVGLDPSSPYYWYTSPDSTRCLTDLAGQQLRHLLLLKGQLASHPAFKRLVHEGELYKSDYGMNMSIWFSINVLDAWARNNNRSVPSILYHGADARSLLYIHSFTKKGRVFIASK